MAETEEIHRRAFNLAFADAGMNWHWSQDDYRALLTTTGGRERIARYMTEQALEPIPGMIAAIHADKNERYAELLASGLVGPRPGIRQLIDSARRRDVALGIATTTSRANIEALLPALFGTNAMSWFAAIVAGEDVSAKKPDPEVYVRALALLDLEPGRCVAIEDSRNGLLAAKAAKLMTVIIPSRYSLHENFDEADHLVEEVATRADSMSWDALSQFLFRSGTD